MLRYKITVDGDHLMDAHYITDCEGIIKHHTAFNRRIQVLDRETGREWINPPSAAQVFFDMAGLEKAGAT